jgi:hypothetical protein
MNCMPTKNVLQKAGMLLLMVAVPAFAQEHKTSSKPTKPASHASTPSHSSTPSHAATQSHTTTPSRTSTAGRATTARPNPATRTGTASRPASSAGGRTHTASRPNTAARPSAGARPAMAAHANLASHTPPGRTVALRGGGTASVRPNGQVRSFSRGGMTVTNNLHGGRTIVSVHNGATIVTHGRVGYVQRPYLVRGGVSYVSRTFVVGGVVHVGVYRSFYWGGHPYFGWRPGFFWHPGFYAWGWHPWGAPLYWGVGLWGWHGPWWGFYGGWWNPYPYYAAPYFWLTDYLIAANLQAAYAANYAAADNAHADEMAADAAASDAAAAGNAPPPADASAGGTPLSPELKDAIAQEVKAQLAAQQQQAQTDSAPSASAAPAAAQAPPPALDPAQRTFIVNADLTVVSNGQECALSSGDVLTRLTDAPDADQTVNASVSATKKSDCAAGSTVAVKVDDLQEMYNHFQETLQNGMSEMAKKQGSNGMPAAPDTGTTASSVPPPPPDPNAAADLQQQQQQASQADSQVQQQVASSGGGTQ